MHCVQKSICDSPLTCIFVKYQTGPIADPSFKAINMTLVKFHFKKNKVFASIVQMYFQSSSEWLLQFRTYDKRSLHFCRIWRIWMWKMSNMNHCFEVCDPSEIINFSKVIFTVIIQLYFQSFSVWSISFIAYDTCFYDLWHTGICFKN